MVTSRSGSVKRWTRIWLASALAALAIVGCAGQRFIDGIPVGDVVPNNPQFIEFAIATLAAEDPGHADVSGVAMYQPDYRMPDGSQILWTRSGDMGNYVVALHLTDGRVRAFFVMCGAGLDTKRCFLGPPDLS